MKCDDCAFAKWQRTANGRLHPSKQGRCTRLDMFPLDMRLPSAFYWLGWQMQAPMPSGGFIERGKELREKCIFKDGSGKDWQP